METLNNISSMMLILISAGAAFRVGSHFLAMLFNPDDKDIYIKKIKNAFIAIVVSSSIYVIKDIIKGYFGG